MNKIRSIIILSGVLLLAGCATENNSSQECYSIRQFKQFSTPFFESYVMNVRGNTKSRVDIYTQLQYRNLRFEKDGNGFTALYTMFYIVRDSANEIVATMDVDRPISLRTYEESVSQRGDSFLQSFTLEPGRYTIDIESVDNHSKFRSRSRKSITAIDYSSGSFRGSSVLFLNTIVPGERGITLRPILPSSVSILSDSIGVFQEFYNAQQNDTIHIVQRYRRGIAGEMDDSSFPHMMPPYRTGENHCASENGPVYFTAETTIPVFNNSTFQSIQFYPLPRGGHTLIERTVVMRRNGIEDTLRVTNDIFRRERKNPYSVSLDEEVSVLRYILREQEYDSLMNADATGRNARINMFWQERGGAERRKEFLRRIAETNSMFTTCTDGSRTAMGIVYVVCGTPDGIDCKGDFIESWFYNVGDRAYSVQFRATDEKNHTFDIVPFSVSDILWQYSLDQWRRKL